MKVEITVVVNRSIKCSEIIIELASKYKTEPYDIISCYGDKYILKYDFNDRKVKREFLENFLNDYFKSGKGRWYTSYEVKFE